MTYNDLHSKIVAAKRHLNSEIVRLKTTGEGTVANFRQIGDRLDMIHEVERIGIRNLNEVENRKISRMLVSLGIFSDN